MKLAITLTLALITGTSFANDNKIIALADLETFCVGGMNRWPGYNEKDCNLENKRPTKEAVERILEKYSNVGSQ